MLLKMKLELEAKQEAVVTKDDTEKRWKLVVASGFPDWDWSLYNKQESQRFQGLQAYKYSRAKVHPRVPSCLL